MPSCSTASSENRPLPASSAQRLTARTAPIEQLAILLAASLTVSGCAPLIVGGAVVGASALYDRRHYEIVVDDQQIELAAMHTLARDPSVEPHSRISVTSYNRKVLLTGQADSEAVAERAAQRVSRLPKVEQVIDEITVAPPLSVAQESEDAYITSRAKLALTRIQLPDFNPARVKVVTEDEVVYLMGLVSPAEADAAAEEIRYVPGVARVVKLFEQNVPSA